MIVVATDDFEVYHEVVSELRERDVDFTTIEPETEIPSDASVLITSTDETVDGGAVPVVQAEPGKPRDAIEEVVTLLRGGSGRTVVGIDPGDVPGIAVLVDDVVVATFQVPPDDVADVVLEEIADEPDALVRIGDGARIVGARIIDDLEDVPVELVDETGTTPYLGRGTRGLGDVLAAVNIARREGKPVDEREIHPTEGELQRIKERSREQSEKNRAIGARLARRVASGELTISEALDEHRDAG